MERNGSEDNGKGCRATDMTEHTGTDHGLLANGEQFLLFCQCELNFLGSFQVVGSNQAMGSDSSFAARSSRNCRHRIARCCNIKTVPHCSEINLKKLW